MTKSPNDKWLLCQNLDNQITTYSASDRFKLNRKKTFKGHVVAGCVPRRARQHIAVRRRRGGCSIERACAQVRV